MTHPVHRRTLGAVLIAARADLVPGGAIFINATRAADGTVTAAPVVAEKDGVAPAI